MSMTLEEVVEELEMAEFNTEVGSWAEARLEVLIEKLKADIAERALPVTREWLDSMHETLERCEIYPVKVKDNGYLIGVGCKPVVVTTRGQLLDLLSGLGVTK